MSETTLRLDRPLKMVTICLGQMQTNCYIVENTKTNQAFVFDPGDQGERIMDTLKEDGMELAGVCLTHGHFDHVTAMEELRRDLGVPVYACEQEQAVLADPDKNLSVQFQGGGLHLKADMLLKDGETFEAAGYTFQMLHTPGHTEGSCCYYVKSEKVLFSGDTLFEGSYGRIDFPTGSGRQMIHSVADILLNLPDDTNVYPGHMGYTTIADEKQYNPLAGYRGREA